MKNLIKNYIDKKNDFIRNINEESLNILKKTNEEFWKNFGIKIYLEKDKFLENKTITVELLKIDKKIEEEENVNLMFDSMSTHVLSLYDEKNRGNKFISKLKENGFLTNKYFGLLDSFYRYNTTILLFDNRCELINENTKSREQSFNQLVEPVSKEKTIKQKI